MNREKSNPTARHTFPEPLDFSIVKKSREWRGRWRLGVRLGGWPDAGHRAFDGIHCGVDIFPGRPSFHSFAGSDLELGQIGSVRKYAAQQAAQGLYISTRIYKRRIDGRNQVAPGAHAVAGDHRATAEYSFIYHDSERVIFRGQYHHIGGRVERRQLRLIDESQEAHSIGDAETRCLSLQFFFQRAIACQEQQGIRDVGLSKRLNQVQGSFPWLEFGAKQDDSCFRTCSPGGTDGVAIDFCGLRLPPIVVNNVRDQADALFGDPQGTQ
jgi:hypothetical protein